MLVLSIISLVVWLLAAYYLSKQTKDALAYPIVFIVLFVISYPAKFILSYFGFSVMNPMELHPDILVLTIIIFNLCGFAFLLPWLLWRSRVYKFHPNHVNTRKFSIRISQISLILFMGIFLISFSAGESAVKAVLSFSTDALASRISERGFERTGRAISAFVGLMGQILVAVSTYYAASRWSSTSYAKKIYFLAIGILIAIYFLALTGSKFLALSHIFSFLIFYSLLKLKYYESAFQFSTIIVISLVGLFLVGMLGFIRGFGTVGLDGFLISVFIQLSNAFDAPDNLSYILSRLNNIWIGDTGLSPTIQYLFAWVPRFLWYDKPLIYGNLYIQRLYLYERYSDETGEVISPSMPGEMLVSGGIFFMVTWAFFIGIIYLYTYRKAVESHTFWWPLVYVFLVTNIFGLLRSGTGVIGSLVFYLFGLFFLFMAIKFLKQASR